MRLSERIIDALQVNGPLSVRDLCQHLDEENDPRVRKTLRRLWKKEIILRTKQPLIVNERVHRGREGSVNHTRAVNYYGFADGSLDYRFVLWKDKMKDRSIDSKTLKGGVRYCDIEIYRGYDKEESRRLFQQVH